MNPPLTATIEPPRRHAAPAAPFRQIAGRALTGTAWFVVPSLMSMALCLDVLHYTATSAFKQAPLAITAVLGLNALVASHFRPARLSWPAWCLAAVVVLAAPGLAVNKLDGAESSLFSAVSLMLLPLSVYALPERWLRLDGRRLLRWLGWIGLCYVVGAAVQLVLNRRGLTYLRIHERAFLVPLAVLVPLYLRNRWLTAAGALAVLSVLVIDPRTTLLIVCLITVSSAVFYALDARARRAAAVLLLGLGVVVGLGGSQLLRMVDDGYKGALGKEGNSDFRANLLAIGMEEFRASPLIGDYFRGPTSFNSGMYEPDASGRLEVILAPLHDDYLEFLTKGGLVGGGLLVAGLGGTVWLAWANVLELRRRGETDLANWQAVLCSAVAALMFTILVNPVLNNPVCAAPAYFLVAQVWVGRRALRAAARLTSGAF